jgi:hypothetical protein
MKHFKVTFMKIPTVIGTRQQITCIAEQNYYCHNDKLDIKIPAGYGIAAITEYLPDIYEKKTPNQSN